MAWIGNDISLQFISQLFICSGNINAGFAGLRYYRMKTSNKNYIEKSDSWNIFHPICRLPSWHQRNTAKHSSLGENEIIACGSIKQESQGFLVIGRWPDNWHKSNQIAVVTWHKGQAGSSNYETADQRNFVKLTFALISLPIILSFHNVAHATTGQLSRHM